MHGNYAATWESVRTHTLPEWFEDYKLGIFIHWGIYSVPAFAPKTWELGEVPADETWFCNNPYAEWYFNSINIKRGATYEHHLKTYGADFRYVDFLPQWQAEHWNPQAWARLFQEAGAKYVVLTTKHHDGFCLFPSRYTDYHSVNFGPKRNIMGELTEAVRAQGLKMGAYYSGAIDWVYSPAPIFTESQNMSNTSPTYAYADYAFNQVRELIDDYQPSVLWNDIGWVKQGEHMLPSLLSYYYNAVADGVTNDRWNHLWHDFVCKEYKQGEVSRTQKWEMCRGLGLSFGYNQEESDADYISVEKLIALLVEVVANNGNLLLNVGPKADGTIPEEQISRLKALGAWLAVNGEAIYGTRTAQESLSCPELRTQQTLTLHFTQKDSCHYVFVVGLQQEQAQIHIPMVGKITALQSALSFVAQPHMDGGMQLQIHNYQPAWQVLVFKIEQEK